MDSSEHKQISIRFEVSNQQDENSSSPSDSNNSNNSSVGISLVQSWPSTPETSFTSMDDDKADRLDFYLVEFDRQAYRYYITISMKNDLCIYIFIYILFSFHF